MDSRSVSSAGQFQSLIWFFFPALGFISLWTPLTKRRALTSSWIKLNSLLKRSSNELNCRELGKLTLLLLWHRLWSRLEQEVGVLELHDTGEG